MPRTNKEDRKLKNAPKTDKELRKFGITVSVPFAVIGSYLWWKDAEAAPYILGVATGLFLFGLLWPQALKVVELVWMKLALAMSFVMTRVILTIAFVLVITPFGLLLRMMGKDLLQIKIDPRRRSYWEPVEVDGPQTRPDKPF